MVVDLSHTEEVVEVNLAKYDSDDDPDYVPKPDTPPAKARTATGKAALQISATPASVGKGGCLLFPTAGDITIDQPAEQPATLRVASLYPYQKAGLGFMLQRECGPRGVPPADRELLSRLTSDARDTELTVDELRVELTSRGLPSTITKADKGVKTAKQIRSTLAARLTTALRVPEMTVEEVSATSHQFTHLRAPMPTLPSISLNRLHSCLAIYRSSRC